MKKLLSLVFMTSSVLASDYGCFPDSKLEFPVQTQKMFLAENGLDESYANFVIKNFENTWSDYFATKINKKMMISLDWDNNKVNAYASRDMEDNLIITLTGGMVRHPKQSLEGLYLVLCHELGHYLGGAPKAFRGRSSLRSWSSAEGQADYFATNKCMIKLYDQGHFSKSYQSQNSGCQDNFCHLITKSGLDLGNVFASLKPGWKKPAIDRKAKIKVRRTVYGHPNPQCRFETFMAGEKCRDQFYKDFDDEDFKIGACFSTYRPNGARPDCWFSEKKY